MFMKSPKADKLIQSPGLRLLVLEDFNFVANGGIETVIASLLPELFHCCEQIVWVLPEHKRLLASSRLIKKVPIYIESLNPDPWQPGWFTNRFRSLVSKLDRRNTFLNLRSNLSARSKARRLQSIIDRYKLNSLLNLGVFDQPCPSVNIPIFGIVYDTNYAPSMRESCMKNLHNWAQKSDGIITISSWARQQICLEVPYATSKIHEVRIAVNPPQANLPDRLDSRSKPVTTFLYPASLGTHKNHRLLLKALSILDSQGYRFKMIFCGFNTDLLLGFEALSDWRLEEARKMLAESTPQFRGSISALGMVEQVHLERLFLEANYVLLPSSDEGFGLPLTEAIARSVPVLCSDIPPYREQIQVYGLHAGVRFVSGFEPKDWADAIRTVLLQPLDMPISASDIKVRLMSWQWKDVALGYKKILQQSRC